MQIIHSTFIEATMDHPFEGKMIIFWCRKCVGNELVVLQQKPQKITLLQYVLL